MCGGILITGISFIMADEGRQFTLMWGPVVFGFLLWGKSVVGGLANFQQVRMVQRDRIARRARRACAILLARHRDRRCADGR